MSQQRVAVWEAEAEVDEDLQGVDLDLAIGNYGQNEGYDDGPSLMTQRYRIAYLGSRSSI